MPLGALALAAGLVILAIDWLLVLDAPGEQIRESVVSDVGGAALVVTGMVILGAVWLQRGDACRFQREGIATEAVVKDLKLGFFGTDVTLAFADQSGAQHQVTLRGSNLALQPGFGPGTSLPIRYHPDNPRLLRFQDTLDTLAPRH
ncbi:MAG: hypothetical protein AAGC82_12935 [Pseudomonadota bacterium]